MKTRPGSSPAGGAMMQPGGIVAKKGHAESNAPSWLLLPAESKTR
jgi:hypothetical protein